MKLNRLILPLVALGLVSCSTITPSGDANNSIDNSSYVDITSDSSNTDEIPLSTNKVSSGSIGGALININLGIPLIEDYSYNFSITSSDATASGPINVTISNTNVVSYELVGSTPTLKTHNSGYAIIIIKDSNDFLIYRNVIHVVKPYTNDNIVEHLIDVDSFKSFGSSYESLSLTFLSDSTALLQGNEGSSSIGSIYLNYSYAKFNSNSNDFVFNVTIDKENSSSIPDITLLYVGNNGYELSLYGNEGLYGIFFPESK